jgi:hypothetical protein
MQKLDQIFDILPTPPATLDVAQTVLPVTVEGSEEDADFQAARANTYEILDQLKAGVGTALKVAAESENPRALEVLGNMLKIASDVNKTLILLSKDRADTKTAKGTRTSQPVQQIGTQQNVTFVGSAGDMNKMLAERMALAK